MAVYILWLRQLKRFIRSKARIVGSLGMPILFLVALGFGFGPIYAKAGEGNYLDFLAPGIIGMTILFTSMFSGIEVIWDKQFGFLKETLVAPVSRLKIMLGRTFGGATIGVLQGLLIFIISLIIGFRPHSWIELPLSLVFMILTALLFTALGTAIASRLSDMQGFQLIMNFIIMPLFFLSGALFPITTSPKVLQTIAMFNPLSYGIDGIRGTLTGTAHYGIILDLIVLSATTFAILILGSVLFEKIEL